MKISGIYKIQSKQFPDRIYIGSAININKRWNAHLNELRNNKHGNQKLQHHFNKYKEGDLEFSILAGCDKDKLIETEQYFMDMYGPYFNIYKTARFNYYPPQSEETKRKRSESMKGKKWSLEARQRFSKKLKGKRIISESARKKISEKLKGNHNAHMPEEIRLRLKEERKGKGNPMYGKKSWNSGRKLVNGKYVLIDAA